MPDTALDRVLAYTSYVQLAGHRRREVALTFDDGPGPYTRAILHILERTRTPATFFVIGRLARANPAVVAGAAREGFAIGDHTESHPYLARMSLREQGAQIKKAADHIHAAGAPHPRLFRPPFGSFNPGTLAILRAQRMLMVLWSVDTKDYARPGVRRIVLAALGGAQPGEIVLMHDGGGNRGQTVAALPRIIRGLRRRRFRIVTIPQLLADNPPPVGQPAPVPLGGRR